MNAGTLIATILRHDKKVASYKIALIRSINDVVLGFPQIVQGTEKVAIPLKTLSRFWIAYYWPFVSAEHPIQQAVKSVTKDDLSFRKALTQLRREWDSLLNVPGNPADGYYLVGEYLSSSRWRNYPVNLKKAFSETIEKIIVAIQQPIRYAGPNQYEAFEKPDYWGQIKQKYPNSTCLPETQSRDLCIVIDLELWGSFCDLSLWIEALSIHEWCLFTERLAGIERGIIYTLLTERPANRRPLTWERNQIEIMMLEDFQFSCPWTGRRLSPSNYDLDHLLPISIYPINELWNMVPADRNFNQHTKRDRMPGVERLYSAVPYLNSTYTNYLRSNELAANLIHDVNSRFGSEKLSDRSQTGLLTNSIIEYLGLVTFSRNLRTF